MPIIKTPGPCASSVTFDNDFMKAIMSIKSLERGFNAG